MPWTGRERRRKRLSEWTGTVIAKSPNGIKAVDKGAWLNFTKEEWRGTPFDEVEKGDRVRIEYSEDKGQTYINVIENLTPRASVGETAALQDSPFPPDEAAAPPGHPLVEEFPAAFEVTPGAPSEPVEPALD